MSGEQLHNRTYLKERRRELRNKLTPAEAALWKMLKNNSLCNRKFRRQHSIENYIVDFYCPSEYLIVELDGQVHQNAVQSEYDSRRDSRLQELGNRVVRFENQQVFVNPLGVLDEIATHFGWHTNQPPKP